jgi:hypothetical protein
VKATTIAVLVTHPIGIPYRTSTPISAGNMAMAFLVTGVVMLLVVGGFVYARRRGWLAGITLTKGRTDTAGIEVIASRRVSMVVTAHVLAYQGKEYLVIESLRGAAATVSEIGKGCAEGTASHEA